MGAVADGTGRCYRAGCVVRPSKNGPLRDAAQPLDVLMFGLNYWPEQTGIAPYTTALAEYLASSGMRVTVVAGMPYYPQWRVMEGYRGCGYIRETVRGVTIVRYRQYVPVRQSAIQRALFEGTFLTNGLRSLRLPRPNLVLGVVPNLAAGVLAALAARRYKVPYGLIFQDLVGQAAQQSGITGGGRVARATAAAEGWIARRAAGVAVISEGFRTYLEGMGVAAERIASLPNWSHIAAPRMPREQVRAQLGWAPDTVVALHAGNMGLKQGLEQLIAAARLGAESHPHLSFVLLGDGNQRPALEARASGLANVEFLNPQPSDWFPEVLQAADVLLVTQRGSVVDMALPSKLTSYFIAGRPMIAAVGAKSATAQAVRESGAGLVVPPEDPVALLREIIRLTRDTKLSEQLAVAGPDFANQHLRPGDSLARASEFIGRLLPVGNNGPKPAAASRGAA